MSVLAINNDILKHNNNIQKPVTKTTRTRMKNTVRNLDLTFIEFRNYIRAKNISTKVPYQFLLLISSYVSDSKKYRNEQHEQRKIGHEEDNAKEEDDAKEEYDAKEEDAPDFRRCGRCNPDTYEQSTEL